MDDFGGMISFLAESEEAALDLVARTMIWKLAESLGGVESLIEHQVDDARLDSRIDVRCAQEPGSTLGRNRVRERPDRGSRAGARALLATAGA